MHKLKSNEARAVVTKFPMEKTRELNFDLDSLRWHAHGVIGQHGFNDTTKDLIELARLIVEIEKFNPKRVSSQRVRSVKVEFALRRPEIWDEKAQNHLQSAIRFMSNSDWRFVFRKRSNATRTSLDVLADNANRVSEAESKKISATALFFCRPRQHQRPSVAEEKWDSCGFGLILWTQGQAG